MMLDGAQKEKKLAWHIVLTQLTNYVLFYSLSHTHTCTYIYYIYIHTIIIIQ